MTCEFDGLTFPLANVEASARGATGVTDHWTTSGGSSTRIEWQDNVRRIGEQS